jgi:hypothetical protein
VARRLLTQWSGSNPGHCERELGWISHVTVAGGSNCVNGSQRIGLLVAYGITCLMACSFATKHTETTETRSWIIRLNPIVPLNLKRTKIQHTGYGLFFAWYCTY